MLPKYHPAGVKLINLTDIVSSQATKITQLHPPIIALKVLFVAESALKPGFKSI